MSGVSGPVSAFTESFESAEQTITAAGGLTLAHGLRGAPSLVQARLICKTAELNYSVGDEVVIYLSTPDGTMNRGLSIVPDATNLNARFGVNGNCFSLFNKTTGVPTNIVLASWKLLVKAWR